MPSLPGPIARFLASEDGPTAVEYAVMLALVVVAGIAATMAVGTTGSGLWRSDADRIVAATEF
jgi:pilus assembly protein Flp/PilA